MPPAHPGSRGLQDVLSRTWLERTVILDAPCSPWEWGCASIADFAVTLAGAGFALLAVLSTALQQVVSVPYSLVTYHSPLPRTHCFTHFSLQSTHPHSSLLPPRYEQLLCLLPVFALVVFSS